MILKSIEYSQYDGTPHEWRLEKFELSEINLLVGENATGKSKILNIINSLSALLSGLGSVFNSANYNVGFTSDETKLNYVISCNEGKVIEEKLNIGRKVLLNRKKDGTGEIYYERLKRKLNFQVPPGQVASVARRDNIQHPFLEDLYQWGETVRHYRFGTDMGASTFAILGGEKERQLLPQTLVSSKMQFVVDTFEQGKKRFPDKFVQLIIKDMNRVGYNLTDIFTAAPFGLVVSPQPILALHVKEDDLPASTSQNEMSQGMFRALSLIIQTKYSQLAESPACILIDDIGEGLDYERSNALVNLLIENVFGTSTQLVMASNDRFVMNNVPLKYWSVVQREGNVSKVLNIHNSPQVFKRFELTGLNNFDFFSTKYYRKGEKQK